MNIEDFCGLMNQLRSSISAQEYARQCFQCIFGGVATTDSADYPTQEQVNFFFIELVERIEKERALCKENRRKQAML